GPFVQLEKKFVRLEPGDDVLTVGMNRALALLNEPAKGRRAAAPTAPLRELGLHPKDNEPIQLLAGRFGPYVKHGKLNASLPKAANPDSFTVEQAVQLLAEREAKLAEGGSRPPRPMRGKAAGTGPKKVARPTAKTAKKAAPKPAARKRS
ncbi:MAG: topoisomerase C-terminal repeat-containing protein, partial [Geminicoccaceae bacterium]